MPKLQAIKHTESTNAKCTGRKSGLGDAIQTYKINNEKLQEVIAELRSRLSNIIRSGKESDKLKGSILSSGSSTFVHDFDEANVHLSNSINDISEIIEDLDL